MCRSFLTTMEVEFVLSCPVLCQVISLFDLLVIVALLQCYEALFVCRLSLATVAVEFALGCLVLLLICYSYIRSALLSCKVIWFFCGCCFIATFLLSVYINVNLNPSRLKLRVDWKWNRSLNISKHCYGWRGCSPSVSIQTHFSLNYTSTPQIRSADHPLVYLSNLVCTSSFFASLLLHPR